MKALSDNKSKLRLVIFSLIGVFNTLFDIVLYVVLYNLTDSVVFANIIATSAALVGSYFLNSRLTFRSKKWTKTSFGGFVLVTVFGLWVLQTGAIYLLGPFFSHLPEHIWQIFGSFEPTAKTVAPKLVATGITFVWNYGWYSKVIFKTESKTKQAIIALEEA